MTLGCFLSRCAIVVCVGVTLARGASGAGDDPDRLRAAEDGEKSKKDQREGGAGGDRPASGDGKKTRIKDPDLRYVRDHLKDRLSPSSIEWHDDGRVSLEFDLRQKNRTHEDIFTTPIGSRTSDQFRWSYDGEETVDGGDAGIRLSDRGFAFFQPWFVDDVEVEIEFLQYSTFQPGRQVAAVVFGSPRKALAANYGSETAYFVSGRKTAASGKPWPLVVATEATFRLRVQNGIFHGERDGRKTPERKYRGRSFDSGQVGLIWGGSIAATVPRFKVKGRLDAKKTATWLRAAVKKGNR